MEDGARLVLQDKIIKYYRKRHIIEPPSKLKSAIQFFAMQKGVAEDGGAANWQVVFHTGANGLNDCVWVPSF